MYEASVSGISAAEERMAVSAHNTANINTSSAKAQRIRQQAMPRSSGVRADMVITNQRPDIITETVEQIYSPHSLRAHVAAFKTQDEIETSTIDLFE